MVKGLIIDTNLSYLSGLYTRVARQAGVHPSYVSRVARGERRSERISRAIASELSKFVPARDASGEGAQDRSGLSQIDLRRRLLRKLKSNPRLAKMSVMVIDL